MPNHRARALRNNPTKAEQALWMRLRALRSEGFHFRRQAPFDAYIADFVCHATRLIVEVDGGQHGQVGQAERDAARTAWFELRGYRVIRFWNNEVLAHIEGVVLEIRSVLAQQSAAAHPTPNPSPSRGGAMPLPHRDAGGKD